MSVSYTHLDVYKRQGLHLVRQIVDRCGGEISIDTEEGEGTCFTLTFTRKEYQ